MPNIQEKHETAKTGETDKNKTSTGQAFENKAKPTNDPQKDHNKESDKKKDGGTFGNKQDGVLTHKAKP